MSGAVQPRRKLIKTSHAPLAHSCALTGILRLTEGLTGPAGTVEPLRSEEDDSHDRPLVLREHPRTLTTAQLLLTPRATRFHRLDGRLQGGYDTGSRPSKATDRPASPASKGISPAWTFCSFLLPPPACFPSSFPCYRPHSEWLPSQPDSGRASSRPTLRQRRSRNCLLSRSRGWPRRILRSARRLLQRCVARRSVSAVVRAHLRPATDPGCPSHFLLALPRSAGY